MDFNKELEFAKRAIVDSFKTVSVGNVQVYDKKTFDVVTTIDFNMENSVIEKIKKAFPKDTILSEENNPDVNVEKRTWVIDPIDGTVNFSRNSKLFGIQCAFFNNGEPVVSVIYLPKLEELYWAEKGKGAFLNGTKLHIKKTDLAHSIISIGDYPHSRKEDCETQLKYTKILHDKILRIRMFGAASIDFGFYASGRTDGVILFTKNKWDLAPGVLLCREAGAKIFGENGDYNFDERVCLAMDEEVFKLLNKGL